MNSHEPNTPALMSFDDLYLAPNTPANNKNEIVHFTQELISSNKPEKGDSKKITIAVVATVNLKSIVVLSVIYYTTFPIALECCFGG